MSFTQLIEIVTKRKDVYIQKKGFFSILEIGSVLFYGRLILLNCKKKKSG